MAKKKAMTNQELNDYCLTTVTGPKGKSIRKTLSFSRSPQILMAHLVNKANALALPNLKNGPVAIGIVEFKVLVNLARHPGSNLAANAELIGINKAAISRSLSKMKELGLVSESSKPDDERKKFWHLTPAGYELHDYHIERNLQFQAELFEGFSIEQVDQLNTMLSQMMKNIEKPS
jgi:DNA-binding MarR family transcriptional regulator